MDRNDVIALLGLALLAAGLYMIYIPLALVIPGALLIIGAVAGAVAQQRQAAADEQQRGRRR